MKYKTLVLVGIVIASVALGLQFFQFKTATKVAEKIPWEQDRIANPRPWLTNPNWVKENLTV